MLEALVVTSFNEFLPSGTIDMLGLVTAVWVIFWMVFNMVRWRNTALGPISAAAAIDFSGTVKTFAAKVAKDGFYQREVFACSRARWLTHFTIFWGFILLAASTTLSWIMNPAVVPMALTHPVRILGNLGGLLLVVGLAVAVGRRLLVPNVRRTTDFGDALFLFLICATAATGFLVEVANELNLYGVTYSFYFTHLVFIGLLLGTAPFTKFVHAIGRFVLIFVETVSRRL